jgi:hypothetical protein
MCLIVASVTVLLITLLDDNGAKPPIIVAYLRKRNVVLSHCYNSANVIEPREPHTCNIIFKHTNLKYHPHISPSPNDTLVTTNEIAARNCLSCLHVPPPIAQLFGPD